MHLSKEFLDFFKGLRMQSRIKWEDYSQNGTLNDNVSATGKFNQCFNKFSKYEYCNLYQITLHLLQILHKYRQYYKSTYAL